MRAVVTSVARRLRGGAGRAWRCRVGTQSRRASPSAWKSRGRRGAYRRADTAGTHSPRSIWESYLRRAVTSRKPRRRTSIRQRGDIDGTWLMDDSSNAVGTSQRPRPFYRRADDAGDRDADSTWSPPQRNGRYRGSEAVSVVPKPAGTRMRTSRSPCSPAARRHDRRRGQYQRADERGNVIAMSSSDDFQRPVETTTVPKRRTAGPISATVLMALMHSA